MLLWLAVVGVVVVLLRRPMRSAPCPRRLASCCCVALLLLLALLLVSPRPASCARTVPLPLPNQALPCDWPRGKSGGWAAGSDATWIFSTLQSVLLPCQSGPPDGWAGLLDSRLEPALSCWSLFLAPPLFGSVPLCQSKQVCGQRGRAVLGAAFCLVARPNAVLLDRSWRRLAGWTAHTSTD